VKKIVKGTSQLTISNLSAQLISLLLMIIVCRKYYTPSELETFTLFQSAINFFGVVFILKIDSLFFIEKFKENRNYLYKISIQLLIALSFLFLIFNLFVNVYSFNFELLLLLCIGIFFMGLYSLSQSKLINENQYVTAAIARILMPLITFIVSLVLVHFSYKENGLIVGLLIGIVFSVVFQHLYIGFVKNNVIQKGFSLMKHYQKDLVYTNFLFVINSFRDTLFILFITLMYEAKDIAASYSQGLRIVSLPSVVLSGALGSVVGSYLKIDVEEKIKFKTSYFRLLIFVVGGALFVYFILYYLMDYLVVLLFTSKWLFASECAKSLIPLLFMKFILNALNGYFLILRLQKINLFINIFDISFFILSFLIFGQKLNFVETLWIASSWSLIFGTILIIVLTKKINEFSKIQ
jgi:O-antigen/teichoic acid export membrane protein